MKRKNYAMKVVKKWNRSYKIEFISLVIKLLLPNKLLYIHTNKFIKSCSVSVCRKPQKLEIQKFIAIMKLQCNTFSSFLHCNTFSIEFNCHFFVTSWTGKNQRKKKTTVNKVRKYFLCSRIVRKHILKFGIYWNSKVFLGKFCKSMVDL